MFKLLSPTRALLSVLSVTSLMAIAGTFSDWRYNSDDFMYEYDEDVQIVGSIEDDSDRVVASFPSKRIPAVQYIGVNQVNRLNINGKWNVTRILNKKGHPIFDKYNREEDKKKSLVVDLEQVSTSTVMVDNDKDQVFQVSLLTNFGTIVLFKKVGKGFEILEARKVKEGPKKSPIKMLAPKPIQNIAAAPRGNQRIRNVQPVRPTARGIREAENVDLVLERALNPSVSKTVMKGGLVEGSATISSKEIIELSATISLGSSKEQEISLTSARINDGGQFEGEFNGNVVTGIVTNNGQGGYRIRFATGPLQGTMLNFVTDEEYDKIQAREEEEAILKAEQNEIVRAIQRENGIDPDAKKEKARKIAAEGDEEEIIDENGNTLRNSGRIPNSEEEEDELIEEASGNREDITEEEIVDVTNEKGFDFNSPVERANYERKNKRAPASYSGADEVIR